ncbi:hypothetical protein RHA1_ro08785 (plasmid) [Rhodococcus jostii RHA1]|uniref:Uncharacterized protein n=1 Tax=Rhodococcus jostii (strain RHA1) TaxID=101510 RepID=Q0RY07_RHOJR|nr:hypothetical protein RHA1_ro08785 [Rhodococcus jostii RHA1]
MSVVHLVCTRVGDVVAAFDIPRPNVIRLPRSGTRAPRLPRCFAAHEGSVPVARVSPRDGNLSGDGVVGGPRRDPRRRTAGYDENVVARLASSRGPASVGRALIAVSGGRHQ